MASDFKLGLALGSGGARGLSHAGVLAALEEAGLRPDVVTGTSMGAIVGGIYAETVDAKETWRRLIMLTEDENFLSTWAPFIAKGSGGDPGGGLIQDLFASVSRKFMVIRTATRPSLVSADKLRKPLASLFTVKTFEELTLPFAAVGVDLISGKKEVFKSGDLIQGIYASSAIPGVFPPLELDGKLIVDGGAPFRVPLHTCRDLGADLIIAVDIPAFESSKTEYKTGMDLIMRSDTIAKLRLDKLVIGSVDFVVSPEVSEYHWADFRCAELCRERGYEATRAAIPRLQREIDRRRSFWYRLRRKFERNNDENP
jgi:NTE family protein